MSHACYWLTLIYRDKCIAKLLIISSIICLILLLFDFSPKIGVTYFRFPSPAHRYTRGNFERSFLSFFITRWKSVDYIKDAVCARSSFLLNGASLSSSNRSLWSFVLYSAQNCGGKARLIGLKNVVCMVPRFPAKSLGQESTSWTCIVNCIRVDRAFPLVWETISE